MNEYHFRKAIHDFDGDIYDAVKKTQKTRKEHGFVMCRRSKKNYITGMCAGEQCSLELPTYCGRDAQLIGSFHTHPSGVLLPTADDVAHSYSKGEEYLCIANSKGKTRCWQPNYKSREFKDFIRFLVSENTRADRMLFDDLIYKKGDIVKQVAEYDVL